MNTLVYLEMQATPLTPHGIHMLGLIQQLEQRAESLSLIISIATVMNVEATS